MALDIGSVIQGKYRITRLIGQGGMGSVYEGENVLIKRRVAIKVLHNEITAHPEAVERFEREAQAAGRIGNDHILEVIDLGTLASGERFMVMEYLDGESLEERLSRISMLSARDLYPIARQLLQALDAAHQKGIIHRDLKPENVFVVAEKAGHTDFVKLIDFGISKFTASKDLRMTATGAVMGTPYYMSPEQAKGSKEVDTRSDLYSVGVILYRSVTGHVPFPGDNFNEVLFKVVLSEPTHPRELAPALEAGFENIIFRSMAKEADHRFQTASEFIAALDAWFKDGATVSLPPSARLSQGQLQRSDTVPASSLPLAGGTPAPSPGAPISAATPLASQNSPGVTTAEWTNSGYPPKKSNSLLWVVATVFLGGGALVGGAMWLSGTEATAPSDQDVFDTAASRQQLSELEALGPNEPELAASAEAPAVVPVASGGAMQNGDDEGRSDGSAGDLDEAKSSHTATEKAPAKKRPIVRVPIAPVQPPQAQPPKASPPKEPSRGNKDEVDFGY